MSGKGKERLDRLVVERGLTESREKARALILAGRVFVDGRRIDKAGKEVSVDAKVSLSEGLPYVSRGGIKLKGALDTFGLDVKGFKVMDVGASTGGFTDCLLQHGAEKVFAVDVGYGLLDWRLRKDERVEVLEKRNVRYLSFEEIGEQVDLITIDLSFISLEKVIPNLKVFLKSDGSVLALVKPQFEVGKGEVGKGGIVRNPEKHKKVIERLTDFSISHGFKVIGSVESPIRGSKGNREFWLYLKMA